MRLAPELRQAALARLLRRARPFARGVALALGLALVASGGRYARAWLAKPLLDDVLLDDGALAPIALVAVALVVVIPAAELTRGYVVEHVLGRVRLDIERAVCAVLLALPLSFHRDRRRGDLLSRSLRDVDAAHTALRTFFGDLALAVVMVAVGSVTLVVIAWPLALVLALAGPALFAIVAGFGRRIQRRARRRQETWSEVTQRLVEILEGIRVVKAFRAEALEESAFRRTTERLFRRSMSVARQRVLARSSVEILNGAAGVAVVMLGAWGVRSGRFGLSPGDLVAFAAALATMYRPVKTLAKGWVRLVDAEPAAARLFELLDAPRGAPEASRARGLDGVSRGVRLVRVGYAYGETRVLREVSFEARPGEVVAIVGRSGAGKTTLLDLLLRFDDPTSGSIEVDGVDLREIDRNAWLRHVAVVSQEPFLFDGSVRDNIRYGRPEAGDADVETAGRAAHVDDFADALPNGWDTEVGAGGARLSGGQRQRVAIARALLRDPAVLILDEATSSLDLASERRVQDAVDALLGGRIVFVVAHRPSTLRRADRIVVLERGQVRQVGTPVELAARSGPFRELFGDALRPSVARAPLQSSP